MCDRSLVSDHFGVAWSWSATVVRKPLKEGQILCVGLDGTGVPALPSETAGRNGKDGANPTGSPRGDDEGSEGGRHLGGRAGRRRRDAAG